MDPFKLVCVTWMYTSGHPVRQYWSINRYTLFSPERNKPFPQLFMKISAPQLHLPWAHTEPAISVPHSAVWSAMRTQVQTLWPLSLGSLCPALESDHTRCLCSFSLQGFRNWGGLYYINEGHKCFSHISMKCCFPKHNQDPSPSHKPHWSLKESVSSQS